jgi:predicted metallo-beta-lactamase superfamily hydrolase
MTEKEAIKHLQAIVKDTTARINCPHIGTRSWNYEKYKEQREKAKRQVRVLRGGCKISKQLVMESIKTA